MRRAAAALMLLALPAADVAAQNATPAQALTLSLPHPLGAGETAFIEVQLGTLAKGHVVDITTAAGQPLGTLSPFGARPGQRAGTYTLPVPASAIHDGRLAIRLTITQPGGPRAPTAQEVRGVKLGVGEAR
ncbi:MAG TPA: hypothetical protein VGG01_19015 [Xanthobacteraceae bacterium]